MCTNAVNLQISYKKQVTMRRNSHKDETYVHIHVLR